MYKHCFRSKTSRCKCFLSVCALRRNTSHLSRQLLASKLVAIHKIMLERICLKRKRDQQQCENSLVWNSPEATLQLSVMAKHPSEGKKKKKKGKTHFWLEGAHFNFETSFMHVRFSGCFFCPTWRAYFPNRKPVKAMTKKSGGSTIAKVLIPSQNNNYKLHFLKMDARVLFTTSLAWERESYSENM